ncbi:hypothetical protein BDV59DRAFT_199684 [Aspergillus ambiguus]|uniref:Ser/Thr protein phosphatase superfamily n=1 Tax=Aspergillus ambiguus TaxID=176160 RepID=UPI003CCCC893
MARIQILSDLHLETPAAYDGFFPFLTAQLRRFQIVFLLLGNHEPYHSSWSTVKTQIADFSDNIGRSRLHDPKLGQFLFLDQTRFDLTPEVTLLGCTLHSNVSQRQEERVSFGLNDFYQIQGWTVTDHRAAHEADCAWLDQRVADIAASEPHRRIVILTHHSPTIAAAAVNPIHATSPISSGFATDLTGRTCWQNPQVRLWAFGHTHYNCDYVDESTGKRVLTNQRGYYFAQAEGFDTTKVIEI